MKSWALADHPPSTRLYATLSGMTGTATTENSAGFHQTYKLGVVPIPTNRPMVHGSQVDMVT